MDDLKLKNQIGKNIVAYRKHLGMTQAELAARLNYSDKAVSKWERGESVPDVLTLVQLADQFDITVNELIADPDALPEQTGAVQRAMGKAVEKTLKRKADKRIIQNLSSLLVWFVALLIFVVLSMLDIPKSWIAFIYALPSDAIVMLSLRSAWRDFRWNKFLISAIMWGGLASIYATIVVLIDPSAWFKLMRLFLLGIPGQAAILLWFRLYRRSPKEEENG